MFSSVKIILIFTAVLAFALSGCQKEDIIVSDSGSTSAVAASIERDSFKTDMNEQQSGVEATVVSGGNDDRNGDKAKKRSLTVVSGGNDDRNGDKGTGKGGKKTSLPPASTSGK